ncbi:MAG: transporter [Verrucomicrobiales bacterium]|nr:transporter [Verrucomicrobiales bacterium]
MKSIQAIPAIALAALSLSTIQAGEPAPKEITSEPHCSAIPWDDHRVDSHAPIGVMGDHTHHAGEMMLSYRYMFMDMATNYVGSDEVSARSQLSMPGMGPYQVMPLDMQTQMHMVGAMYAPTDEVTLMAMMPYIDKQMNHLVANGTTFETGTSGSGDFKFGGLVKFYDKGNTRAHLNLVMSAPTGSIEETGFVPPMGRVVRLPYPMQLGSGTWDFKPGVTYLGQCGDLSWGAQVSGTLRIDDNDAGYSLGDEIGADIWGALRLSDSFSTSLRISGESWGVIDGRDPLIMGPVPTANPALRGGERIDIFAGINYYCQSGPFKGHRLAVEAGAPIYQDLDGPQLGMDWMITLGWQKAF